LLNILAKQIPKPYEVIIITQKQEPYRNLYKKVINTLRSELNIKHIVNPISLLAHSYNLGIRASQGDILLFLDDDVVPLSNIIYEHVRIYKEFKGVCGVEGKVRELNYSYGRNSNGIKSRNRFYYCYSAIHGLENFHNFLTKCGRILSSKNDTLKETLLKRGGNMSILRSLLQDLLVDENQKHCIGFETILHVKILSKIPYCKFIYNPKAVVLHLRHPQSISRAYNFFTAYEIKREMLMTSFRLLNIFSNEITIKNILLCEVYEFLTSIKNLRYRNVYRELGYNFGRTIGFVLELLHHKLTSYNVPMTKIITLTFDDGYRNVYRYALPILNEYGYRGVVFIITGLVGSIFEGTELMDISELSKLLNAKWEVGSHTHSHPRLTMLNTKSILRELRTSSIWIEKYLGFKPLSLAYPYGDFDLRTTYLASKYYEYGRTIAQGINTLSSWIGSNKLRLRALVVYEENIAKVKEVIKRTSIEGGWLILVFHNIVKKPEELPKNNKALSWITLNKFKELIGYINKFKLQVKTFTEQTSVDLDNR